MMTTDIIDNLDIDKILNLSNIDDSFEKTTAPLGLYRKSDHILSNVNLTPFSEKRSVEKIYNALKEIITDIVAKCNSLQSECNELQDNTTKLRNDILDIIVLPKMVSLDKYDGLIYTIKYIIKYVNILYPETRDVYSKCVLNTYDDVFNVVKMIKDDLFISTPAEIKTIDDVYETIKQACKKFNINYIK